MGVSKYECKVLEVWGGKGVTCKVTKGTGVLRTFKTSTEGTKGSEDITGVISAKNTRVLAHIQGYMPTTPIKASDDVQTKKPLGDNQSYSTKGAMGIEVTIA